MKFILILSISILGIGCGSSEKPNNTADASKVETTTIVVGKDSVSLRDVSKIEITGKTITIDVSYAAIACGCPQWFETSSKNVKSLGGVERYYLEPTRKELVNALDLWDGKHLPFTVKVSGRFSKDKELPVTFNIKEEQEKARIFIYDEITVVSPSYPILPLKPDLPYTRLTANLNLKIDSLRKQVDSTSTFFQQYAKQVAAWNLTAPEIKTILLASEEIDGHEFHYNYSVLPCFYTGQIILDRKRAFFELNAGAHCTIFFKDSTIRLGYKRADAEKRFLSGPEEQ